MTSPAPDLEPLIRWCAEVLQRGLAGAAGDPAATSVPPLPALLATALRRHGFDDFDTTVLALALAPELDPMLAYAVGALERDARRVRPSLDLISRLVGAAGPDRTALAVRLSPDSRLARLGLLRIGAPPGNGPLPSFRATVAPTAAVLRWILGLTELDEALAPLVRPAGRTPAVAPDERLAADLAARLAGDRRVFAHVAADKPDDGADCALVAAARAGVPALLVDAAALVTGPGAARVAAEVLLRDALAVVTGDLAGVPAAHWAPLTDAVLAGGADSLPPAAGSRPVTSHVLAAWPGRDAGTELAAALDRRGVARNGHTTDAVAGLSRWEHLAGTDIERIADGLSARALGRTPPLVTDGDLAAVAAAVGAADLTRLAEPLATSRQWDGLVLPQPVHRILRDLCDQAGARRTVPGRYGLAQLPGLSAGVTALFAGPSGTGKTFAARLVAGELGLPLYRVDLARIVSKYIGETERNLDLVFAAAERSDAVLLFDEAEALFGKRSEVQDAHDRYANLEIAFLLQRMETYDGVALLATNLLGHLDDAFARRLSFCVHFPFPEAALRRRIWTTVLAATPLAPDVDLDRLAEQYQLAGGQIRNIAVAAAHLAAAGGRPIDDAAVRRAVEREYGKVGMLPPDATGEPR